MKPQENAKKLAPLAALLSTLACSGAPITEEEMMAEGLLVGEEEARRPTPMEDPTRETTCLWEDPCVIYRKKIMTFLVDVNQIRNILSPSDTTEEIMEEVSLAGQAWEKVSPDLPRFEFTPYEGNETFTIGEEDTDGDVHVITARSEIEENAVAENYVRAFQPENGDEWRIYDSDIIFDSDVGFCMCREGDLTCPQCDPYFGRPNFQGVLAHELGHAIGINDNKQEDSTMYKDVEKGIQERIIDITPDIAEFAKRMYSELK